MTSPRTKQFLAALLLVAVLLLPQGTLSAPSRAAIGTPRPRWPRRPSVVLPRSRAAIRFTT